MITAEEVQLLKLGVDAKGGMRVGERICVFKGQNEEITIYKDLLDKEAFVPGLAFDPMGYKLVKVDFEMLRKKGQNIPPKSGLRTCRKAGQTSSYNLVVGGERQEVGGIEKIEVTWPVYEDISEAEEERGEVGWET